MNNKLRLILIGSLISSVSAVVHGETFADFLNAQKDNSKAEFQQFKAQEKDEFELYKKELQDAFIQYKQKVAGVWGKKKAVIPTKKRDVSYLNNLKQRSIIDYAKGQVKIDIAVTPEEARNKALLQKKMQKALNKALKQGSDKRSIIEIAKKPVADSSTGPAVLAKLVQDRNGKTLKPQDTKRFVTRQSKKLSLTKTRGTDNRPRVIVSTSFPMIPKHLEVRARKYLSPVKKYSANMKLPPELVFAIMETESAFNPNARSSVPAFGLMQLVPTSGARDAYRLLYKRDKVVSDRYLYNPDNNIKMGTAFIHKLYYSYLSGISDPESRTWATIAGYNTGAGNVFNTFAGKYRRSKFGNRSNWKKKALSIINSKTPEQVYSYMKRNLPHAETKHYIKNIRKRITKYKSL